MITLRDGVARWHLGKPHFSRSAIRSSRSVRRVIRGGRDVAKLSGLSIPSKGFACVRTFSPKPSDIHRSWFVVDATGLTLGRMATEVASRLRGKHKPIFAPHVDTGDHVIVINAEKVHFDSKKADAKRFYRYSGYPGGMKSRSYRELLDTKPEQLILDVVRGMLPKNTVGRQMLSKLRVYSGSEHPHIAQSPTPLDLPQARRAS